MLVKFDDPRLFLDVISMISELVTEVRLKVNPNGMGVVAVDPANVALVSLKLPKEAFSQFESGEEILGLNLENLKNILRRAKTGSSLIMQTQENFLRINIIDRIKREFMLALIDVESEEKEIQNLEFTTKIEMNSVDFMDVIEDCIVVADTCNFISEPNKFIIEAKGLNSMRAEFSSDEVKIENSSEGEEIGERKSKYSLEYLQKFIKAGKIAEKIIINFADDYPLRLDFKNKAMELSFILAPRVETED